MSETKNGKNRRKRERLNLSLPVRVQYRGKAGKIWEEVTRLIDVTPFGAGFALTHSIEIGRLIQLTLPMPRQLRCYDHLEQQYQIWGLVRYIRPYSPEDLLEISSLIGVAFIGKSIPTGYAENPEQIYEIIESEESGFWQLREETTDDEVDEQFSDSEAGVGNADLRRQLRHLIPLNVTIEVFNERGETVASEITTTEDVSVTGAAVFTTLEIAPGRLIRLNVEEYEMAIVAIVRARKIGKDGIARLHLEFIDRDFPTELLG